MFGKLKEKLKDALNIFKSEDTPEEPVIEEKVEEPKKEENIETDSKTEEETVKEPETEEVEESVHEEPQEEEVEEVAAEETIEEPTPEVTEEPVEKEVIEETPSEPEQEAVEEKPAEETPAEEDIVVEESKEIIEEPVPEVEEVVVEKPKEEKGFFTKLKEKFTSDKEDQTLQVPEKEKREPEKKEEETSILTKVKQTLTTKTINEEKFEKLFWELEVALLENNVSVKVIEKIKEDLKEELVDKPLPRDVPAKIQEVLRTTLREILSHEPINLSARIKEKEGPFVIAFFGINGAGKTTSIAKLTHHLKDKDHTVVLAACDTFRAAAIQQLEEHARNLDVKMIQHEYGSDAAAVAYDAIQYAQKNNVDVVLIDTAGRLHSNTNLMQELEKIIRVTKPDLKLFVGESITGNDCIEQAEKFNELVEMDGVILTKADIDEKGGAPLSISYVIKKPILFLGVGQEYKDLEEFNTDVMLDRLF